MARPSVALAPLKGNRIATRISPAGILAVSPNPALTARLGDASTFCASDGVVWAGTEPVGGVVTASDDSGDFAVAPGAGDVGAGWVPAVGSNLRKDHPFVTLFVTHPANNRQTAANSAIGIRLNGFWLILVIISNGHWVAGP
ncbi:MAG: hypothetical protein HOJ06_18125 [Rhodospirillaceae bacterium]|nr:hypothetical protein [Rhodospirillaceae bacterium]